MNGKASGIASLGLAASLAACTLEQVQLGQWYRIDTPPDGACPALEWHFVVDARRTMAGELSRPPAQPFARLSGVLDPDDSFRLQVTGAEGRADVTGRIGALVTTIAVAGPGAGAGCDGKTFTLRLGRYYQLQSGGGGGGGR